MNLIARISLVAAGLAAFTAPLLARVPGVPQTPDVPKWEAVSVKPCTVRVGRGGGIRISPGHMVIDCQPLDFVVGNAYVMYAGGRAQPIYATGPGGTAVEGGPSWLRTDRFTIDARAEGTPTPAMMQGPMLQTILENRFQLAVHRETRKVPVYHLTIGPGGPKLPTFKAGTCTPLEVRREAFKPPPLPPGKRYCDSVIEPKPPNVLLHAEGTSVEEFSELFLSGQPFVGRRVVDRTGLRGLYNIDVEFAMPIDAGAGPPDPSGASIFTALREQLGLRLEPATGTGEFLVVDRVERPTEN